MKDAGAGGKGDLPMNGILEIVKTKAWDGKDREVMEEDSHLNNSWEVMTLMLVLGTKDEL